MALVVSTAVRAQDAPAPQSGPGEVAPPEGGAAEQSEAPAAATTNVLRSTETAGGTPWDHVIATTPAATFLETEERQVSDPRPPPSAEQVAALQQLEEEVGRFEGAGQAFRRAVLSQVRREYLRQRRARDHGYARQVSQEEELQAEAREKAIRVFERFIERYPNDLEYTPDAMFRLGELYYERSALQFQRAYELDPLSASNTPDFNPTIELYRKLSQNFPEYRLVDGVYYLIGYCLNEMGLAEEARMAWLNLVCANKYRYDPSAFAVPDGDEVPEEEPASPALTLGSGEESATAVEHSFVDPYDSCAPVRPNANFISETWFRVGEYHFDDYGADDALEHAISAYQQILSTPEDRNYNLALYKVAWAYYRSSRYEEAIRHFGMLVQWSDDERKRTGRAGSELRPEAVQYLGISFAYDDWNENQVPDPIEGFPTGIDRVQNSSLLPQDQEWTPEVYFQLGDVYFEENKLPEAIEVWQLALQKFPNHHRAPEITNQVALAFARNQEMEDAISWRARLGTFGEGSDWWDSNVDHPREQREAEGLAENALVGSALHYHEEAQRLKRNCVAQEDLSLCNKSEEYYGLAAEAYQSYLDRYPNNPQAYELRYNLADAYYWAGNYEEAARQYASVRDSNLDDAHLSESARLVVESLKRIVEREQERGAISPREEPPEPQGAPPIVTPIALPELVQRLARSRETYLARVDPSKDSEGVRAPYDFNNALLLYVHGYWPQARERFERIFDERCSGEGANQTGRIAWINLRNMAAALEDDAELSRLATAINERQCTFQADGAAEIDCAAPENRDEPRCIALEDITRGEFRQAIAEYKRAEASEGESARAYYESAATLLVQAVNETPDNPQAPLALEYAATALARTSRFESAARLYQRIVDEVGPRRGANPEEQERLDAIMANAYYQLAYNSNRFFDFDRALENYRLLADASRFDDATNEVIIERREGALINAAVILERLQQYDRAATYYGRVATTVQDAGERRNAAFRVAEMAYKRRSWNQTVRRMNEFIAQYRSDPNAGELTTLARWRIAQARKEANARASTYRNALQDVVSAFSQSGQTAGSIAAEYAAHAGFILVDDDIERFESFEISPGRPRTLEEYVQTITDQINSGSERAQGIVDGYEPLLTYRRPAWTIAAYVRQGRAYEILVRGVLRAEFVVPSDLQRQMRALPPEDQDQIRLEVETTIQTRLDERVRPLECFAVARYALAARASRVGNLDTPFAREAVDRLQAYGDERIAECIAEAQRTDPGFQAYQPGEFRRAPRGLQRSLPAGAAAPAPVVGGGGR